MKRLWLKITVSFSLLTLALLIIIWLITASVSKTTYTDTIRDHLLENAELVSEMISTAGLDTEAEDMQVFFDRVKDSIDMRVTVTDTEGTVIADSENAPSSMENHRERPEIDAVLDGRENASETVRTSETGDIDMMYVAVPLKEESGEISGVVRTSYSLSLITETTQYLWKIFAGVLGVVLLISVITAVILSRSITRPVTQVIKASGRLQEKDYSTRISEKYKGEMGDLAQSVNSLAASLQEQSRTINENEQQLKSILSNLVSGVMLINSQGIVEMINASMEQILSQHRDHIIHQRFDQYGESIGLEPLIANVFEENEKIHTEITAYYPVERKFDTHISPYYGGSWQQRGVIIVLHDITEIRHLEQMRSDFVANVSHELKTPITSVKGFAETLLSDEVTDKETEKQFLQIILDESVRLNRLIQDLLYLSKIEKNSLPLNIEKIELRQFINDIVATLQTSIHDKNIVITLPDPREETVIEGDQDRLKQVILNLVSNAVNYSYENSSIKIDVEDNNDDTVKIYISDHGIGIPSESLDRIFERFYRVDKARSRHSGGTGLGLAIVKHLVETHQGEIKVDSIEHEGTTFTLILPKHLN
jgi:two-component system phosphate regulon sensor histidine kinase PhoR